MARGANPDLYILLDEAETREEAAALLAEAVACDNPSEGEWYHWTGASFEEFSLTPPERRTGDWNSLLGVHFSRSGDDLREMFFADFDDSMRMITAKIEMHNPRRFLSELDFDLYALSLLIKDGLTYEEAMKSMRDMITFPGQQSSNTIARITQEEIKALFEGKDVPLSKRLHEDVRMLLWQEKIRNRAAQLALKEMKAEGYDGVIYANDIDSPCVSAIAFDPAQIKIS
jgi:hypothetical protein